MNLKEAIKYIESLGIKVSKIREVYRLTNEQGVNLHYTAKQVVSHAKAAKTHNDRREKSNVH